MKVKDLIEIFNTLDDDFKERELIIEHHERGCLWNTYIPITPKNLLYVENN